ncbi:MAG TPA: head decoration protein [Gemmatimonadaceae bacterium]|nr:head decoration protein [Gemmatimonadaceae bacterium]
MPAEFNTDTFTPDALIAGETILHHEKVTLLSGENRTRGAVLGKITASGKYQLSASAAVDGSETPVVILAEDCDASAADADCLVYTTGDFDDSAITLGAGHTVASVKDGLADRGIFLISTSEA